MKFRKIKMIPYRGNSDQNIILRQLWAKEYLKLLGDGKVILNIDETFLGMSDFRRYKWQVPGTTNSISAM